MTTRDAIVGFADRQLDSICRRPALWGGGLCAELQILLLLEVRWLAIEPAMSDGRLKVVQRRYAEYVRRGWDSQGAFLAKILEERELGAALRTFVEEQQKAQEQVAARAPASQKTSLERVKEAWRDEVAGVRNPERRRAQRRRVGRRASGSTLRSRHTELSWQLDRPLNPLERR